MFKKNCWTEFFDKKTIADRKLVEKYSKSLLAFGYSLFFQKSVGMEKIIVYKSLLLKLKKKLILHISSWRSNIFKQIHIMRTHWKSNF